MKTATTVAVLVALGVVAGCSSPNPTSPTSSAPTKATPTTKTSAPAATDFAVLQKNIGSLPKGIGTPVWGVPFPGVGGAGTVVAVNHNTGNGPKTVVDGLDSRTGKKIWTLDLSNPGGSTLSEHNPPTVTQIGGALMVQWRGTGKATGDAASVICVYSLSTGKQLGKTVTTQGARASVLSTNGHVGLAGAGVFTGLIDAAGRFSVPPAAPNYVSEKAFTKDPAWSTTDSFVAIPLSSARTLFGWESNGSTSYQVGAPDLSSSFGSIMKCTGSHLGSQVPDQSHASPDGSWTANGTALINPATGTVRCLTGPGSANASISVVADDGSAYGTLGASGYFHLPSTGTAMETLSSSPDQLPHDMPGGSWASGQLSTVFFKK